MTRKATSDESTEQHLSAREQRETVRKRYGTIADDDTDGSCCGEEVRRDQSSRGKDTSSVQSSCCEPTSKTEPSCCGGDAEESISEALGYSREELASVADGANLGLGCGNPNAIAGLNEGETVLDLGSGGGFDCFLAAEEVGESGQVIGVDMTPKMIERARENVEKNDATNVEFRLGEIENLPVPDERIDVIISNCVINLSPDKRRVFEEAYRVLRPGGRLAISDVVLTADPPSTLDVDPESVAACVGGASPIDDLRADIETAGFESVSIRPKEDSEEFISEWSDEYSLEAYLVSAVIEGTKPPS